MSKVKNGDNVKVHYTGKLENGEVFDSSNERPPLEFQVGSGNVIPGFENGVIGMEVGESKNITISSEDAYGPKREELVIKVTKSEFPENITPSVGQQLQVKHPDGNAMNVMIIDMDEESVTLDANHPLAGETLLFDVELVEITE